MVVKLRLNFPLYLDYNATTPLDPQVLAAMTPYWEEELFGNPSSLHSFGRRAKACLEEQREKLASLLGCNPSELIFTSGGTEANSLAIIGTALAMRGYGRHVVTSAIEHPSVLKPIHWLVEKLGFSMTIIPTDTSGLIDPGAVNSCLRTDTVLVSIGAANNEVGTIQPLKEIAQVVRPRGIIFHTDASQAFGKVPVRTINDSHADLVTCCAHKLFGPKGIGVLYVRSPTRLEPVITGGAQEHEKRAGTENLAAVAGLVAAFVKNTCPPCFNRTYLAPLTAFLETQVSKVPGVRVWGPQLQDRLPNTLAISVEGTTSQTLLAALDLAGICVSAGSACSTGALKPSHVLLALGATTEEASSLIRFSLGPETTRAEIECAAATFAAVIAQVRN